MTKSPEDTPDNSNERIRKSVIVPAKELQASFRRAGTTAGAAYSLIGAILFLGAVGYFADGWLGTEPWLLVSGLLLGIVVGFYELARVVWRRTP